jgi:hypothetical protein
MSTSTGRTDVNRRALPSSFVGRFFEEYDHAILVRCLSSRALFPCLIFETGITGVYVKYRRSSPVGSVLSLEERTKDVPIAVETEHGLVNAVEDMCSNL